MPTDEGITAIARRTLNRPRSPFAQILRDIVICRHFGFSDDEMHALEDEAE